jgi:hypothetical protein
MPADERKPQSSDHGPGELRGGFVCLRAEGVSHLTLITKQCFSNPVTRPSKLLRRDWALPGRSVNSRASAANGHNLLKVAKIICRVSFTIPRDLDNLFHLTK